MSYTHPHGQPQGAAKQFTNILRGILIAEIVAINGYQSHIAHSNIPEINSAWHSIMLDEKKHYGWILQLLRKYDPEQYQQYLSHAKEISGTKMPLYSFFKDDSQLILNNIREDVKGELEAVVLYEEELPRFQQKDICLTLHSIIVEEKGHSEHLTSLLLKLDPDGYDAFA